MVRSIRFVAVVGALAFLCSGCAIFLVGAAAGGAGAVYVKGKLTEAIDAPVEVVHKASRQALQKLELRIVDDTGDAFSAALKAASADGKDVWINIQPVTDTSSTITIRVGVIGDAKKSRRILKEVKKRCRSRKR